MTDDKNETISESEGMLEEGRVVTVRALLKGLYEKACQQKLWGLVRHTAGMLGKRVEDLAKAVVSISFLVIFLVFFVLILSKYILKSTTTISVNTKSQKFERITKTKMEKNH